MTIEADIVEALRNSRTAHEAVLAELSRIRAANAALENARDELATKVARLEAEAVNVVEAEAVRPAMEELSRLMADVYGIVTTWLDEDPATGEATQRRRSSARSWA